MFAAADKKIADLQQEVYIAEVGKRLTALDALRCEYGKYVMQEECGELL